MAAQAGPRATYEANLHEAHPGDALEVLVTVAWPGGADAYDVPAPKPTPVAGVRWRLIATESQSDADGTTLQFRWQMAVDAPGAYAVPTLLPVVAYAPDRSVPLVVAADLPLSVTVTPAVSPWVHIARYAGAGTAIALLAGLAAVSLRRRPAGRSTAHAVETPDAARCRDRLHAARGHRMEGHQDVYVRDVCNLARECGVAADQMDELTALRERVAFGGGHLTEAELDRAEAIVRRRIDRLAAPTENDTT